MANELLRRLLVTASLLSGARSAPFLRWNDTSLCSNSCGNDRPLCDCDPLCFLFGECCVDADRVTLNVKRPIECTYVGGVSVFMVSTCDDSVDVSVRVRHRCHTNVSLDRSADPVINTPVTSLDTHITYKNRWCSLCNDDDNVVGWRLRVTLPVSRLDGRSITSTALKNGFAYFKLRQKWGIWLWYAATYSFYPVDVTAMPPKDTEPRRCFRGFQEISSCPPEWKDRRVGQLCETYRDTVSGNFENYKNKHCAQCHGIPEGSLTCRISHTITGEPPKEDVIEFDATSTPGCKNIETNVYDHFLRQCRDIGRFIETEANLSKDKNGR